MAFCPAQKRIQVSDRTRQSPKVLDCCSSSQIHLWSKCQIVRRLAVAEPVSAARRLALAEPLRAARRFAQRLAPVSRPRLTPQI
jgi:hypothetical protein